MATLGIVVLRVAKARRRDARRCSERRSKGTAKAKQREATAKFVKATRRQGNAHQCKGVEMLCYALAKLRGGRRWNRKAMSAALRNGTDKHGGAMAQTRTDLRGQSRGLRRFATEKHRLALPWHRLDKLCDGFAMSSVGIDWHGASLLHIDYAQRRGAVALRREDLRRKEMQRRRAAAPGLDLQRL